MRVARVGEVICKALARGDEDTSAADDGIVVKAVADGEPGVAVENGIKLGIFSPPYLTSIRHLFEVAKVFCIA